MNTANRDVVVFQDPVLGVSTLAALESCIYAEPYREATVITAFATRRGVQTILRLAESGNVTTIRWVLGLDGVVTQPSALSLALESPMTSKVFGWHSKPRQPVLHAKMYAFIDRDEPRSSLYVGSSNLTLAGLLLNVEAGNLATASGRDARMVIRECDGWLTRLSTYAVCQELTTTMIADYERRYRRRPRLPRGIRDCLLSNEDERDEPVVVAGASAWIQVVVRGGSGNQIEI